MMTELYVPPRPKSLGPLAALLRAATSGDSNLIGLLPKQAYTMKVGNLGYSRRSIVIVNDADAVRTIMTDPTDIYPKNDLMVGALAPLVGDSIFVSHGDTWRRQRGMVSSAFSHMKLSSAFAAMQRATDDYETVIDAHAEAGESFSLDLAMSHLTADIICRTVFSTPLASDTAREVFDAFTIFERSVANVEIRRLIFDPPWHPTPQHEHVLEACHRIRARLGELVDRHLAPDADFDDIAADLITARDKATGAGFSREELIDQLGVFFLAGHETTASALTWAFFIIATRPEVAARIRTEVAQVTGGDTPGFQHMAKLAYTRAVFKETMRLYPPIPFIPRVAAEATMIGRRRIKRGAMIMIAPWVIHRHADYWKQPDAFDPERFMGEREKAVVASAYMPFGLGPRVCMGANFATVEATLILARLTQRYDFIVDAPDRVEPVARLTTRPVEQIGIRARRRREA